MSSETAGRQLHDRARRGAPLSAEERARLEEWYVRLDQEEAAACARANLPPNCAALHAQIETAVAQIAAVTQRIQALTTENAAVREDITSLQQPLNRA